MEISTSTLFELLGRAYAQAEVLRVENERLKQLIVKLQSEADDGAT